MLFFSDFPKAIRVFRLETSAGGTNRLKLGVITKKDFEMSEELRQSAAPAEKEEIEQIILLYKSVDDASVRVAVLRFPQTVREVTDYVINNEAANEAQKNLIQAAILDGLRALRRSDRLEED